MPHVGATNPRCGALTIDRLKSKVAASKTKTNQRSKTSPRKNLPCRVGEPSQVEASPRASPKVPPAGLPGPPRASHPAKSPLLHLIAKQVTYKCGVEPPND